MRQGQESLSRGVTGCPRRRGCADTGNRLRSGGKRAPQVKSNSRQTKVGPTSKRAKIEKINTMSLKKILVIKYSLKKNKWCVMKKILTALSVKKRIYEENFDTVAYIFIRVFWGGK